MKFIIIAALAVVIVASDRPYYPRQHYQKPAYPISAHYAEPTYPASNYQKPAYPPTYANSYDYPPKGHSFDWAVVDHPSYNYFGHKESSNGNVVDGTYYVVLPDSRTQIVTYRADSYGYVADVRYEGDAKYPEGKPEYPAYQRPSYNTPSYSKASYPENSYHEPTYAPPSYPGASYPESSYPTYRKPTYRPYTKPSYPTYPRPFYPVYPKKSYPTLAIIDAESLASEEVGEGIEEFLFEGQVSQFAVVADETVIEDVAPVATEPVDEDIVPAAAEPVVEDITSMVAEPVTEEMVPTATEPVADVKDVTTEVAVTTVEPTGEPEVITTDAAEII